jgi:hypothetical protein
MLNFYMFISVSAFNAFTYFETCIFTYQTYMYLWLQMGFTGIAVGAAMVCDYFYCIEFDCFSCLVDF